jgi:hypothetical protein
MTRRDGRLLGRSIPNKYKRTSEAISRLQTGDGRDGLHVELSADDADLCTQYWQESLNDLPHLRVVSVIIVVRKPVAEADDPSIVGDACYQRRIVSLKTEERFADDRERSFHRRTQHRIGLVVVQTAVSSPQRDARAGVGDIVNRLGRLRMHHR